MTVMIRIVPARISDPLAGAPIERLSEWQLSEGYTRRSMLKSSELPERLSV